MFICVRKNDNLVVAVDKKIELTKDYLKTSEVIFYEYNESNCQLIEVDKLPDDFFAGFLKYIDGVFVPTEGFKEVKEFVSKKDKQDILQSIAQLESQITPRRIREALLGDTSFIDGINKQIEELRKELN